MGLELVQRVSKTVLVVLVPTCLAGGVLLGWPGVLGALAGGLISLASLHWIARGVRSAAGFFAGGRAHPLWVLGLGLRYVLLFGAVGLLLVSGAVHPVALMGGLSILPPVLIVLGLRATRATP
jgi:hypothetical protein